MKLTRQFTYLGMAAVLWSAAAVAEEATERSVPEVETPPAPTAEVQRRAMPAGVIQLDETVISGNQELPKVLYILPWQQPSGLPNIKLKAEFTEAQLFRRLYPPAYRRELTYYETLNGSKSQE